MALDRSMWSCKECNGIGNRSGVFERWKMVPRLEFFLSVASARSQQSQVAELIGSLFAFV